LPICLSEFYRTPQRLNRKERLVRSLTRFLVYHADVLFFTTAFQRDLWRAAYGAPRGRALILENVYPPVVMHPFAPGSKTFVAAGRPIRLKNMDVLARSFKRVQAHHPDAVLDTRTLPPKEHRERLQAAYAIIVPSLSEVSPNTVIEAVALGKPFIAPADTGITNRLRGLGVFVDTRDEAALEKAIASLLDVRTYQTYRDRIATFRFIRTCKDIAHDVLTAIRNLTA
jgi:glycosyltransferase involved in cell wall biosynthesis